MVKKFSDRFSCLDTIPACDGQTDGHRIRRKRPRSAERRAGKKNNKKKKQEQTRIIQPHTHILAVLYDCNITDITVNVVTHLRTN